MHSPANLALLLETDDPNTRAHKVEQLRCVNRVEICCAYQLAVAVDEAHCLGNVIQAHGYVLLPGHEYNMWGTGMCFARPAAGFLTEQAQSCLVLAAHQAVA